MIFVYFGGSGKDGGSRISFFALELEPFLPDTHDFRMVSLPLILRKKIIAQRTHQKSCFVLLSSLLSWIFPRFAFVFPT